MTFKEKLAMEPKEKLVEIAVEARCPESFGYEMEIKCMHNDDGHLDCAACWNRDMPEIIVEPKTVPVDEESREIQEMMYESLNAPEEVIDKINACGCVNPVSSKELPHILDSGDRTQFETGAVRDMREGKGRCDLLPLDVVADIYETYGDVECDEAGEILHCIDAFQNSNNVNKLRQAIFMFSRYKEWSTLFLELAKHFEEGAKKYGDNNWRKGIPVKCYIDSAIRHYLKYLRGDKDEPHDRAFCWNILCAIWTCKHMPELNDYANKTQSN